MREISKIGAGIGLAVGIFFIFGVVVVGLSLMLPEEEEKIKPIDEWLVLKKIENVGEQPTLDEIEKHAIEQQKADQEYEERMEQLSKLKTPAEIEQMKQLPDSCNGVNSMELDIYPTGKECFAALKERVEEWCLSQSNEIDVLAKDCVAQFYLKLADTCADPILSSVDVCLMYTFKELYPKLIP